MTGPSDRGQEPIDRWLGDRHHDLDSGLERFLDLGSGLREAMLHVSHADLLGSLTSTLNTSAGLEAILTSPTVGGSQPSTTPGPVQREPGSPGNVDERTAEKSDQTRRRQQLVSSPPSQGGLGRPHWRPSTLLGSLNDVSRERLLRLGRKRQFEAESVLMRQGDRSGFVVVLIDGVVKETAITSTGMEALLAIRVSGDLVGELEAVDGGPCSSTVIASGVVVGNLISQDDFLGVLQYDRHLAQAVNSSIGARLRASYASRLELVAFDAPTRVVRVLWELAVRYGDRSGDRIAIQRLTQAELASLAGVTEPTAQKALRGLRERGLIVTSYKNLEILDVHALERIVG